MIVNDNDAEKKRNTRGRILLLNTILDIIMIICIVLLLL
jgi:hypothetical protein